LGAVAELIETVFAQSLDSSGRRMLRWMQTLGRFGWIGWWVNRWLLPPAAHPLGFVWEENDRIVGNASLLEVRGFPGRWVLSNVAVHPEYRRRGIARALVRACIELSRHEKGKSILLQVDHDQLGAQELYLNFNFRQLITRTTWVRRGWSRSPKSISIGSARRRRPEEWRKQLALARRVHPEGLIWPYPVTSSLFRPRGLGILTGLESPRHWVWVEGGKMLGSLTARRSLESGKLRWILIVEPVARGYVESGLLTVGFADLGTDQTIHMDYPVSVLEADLRAFGFKAERTLTWMELDLQEVRGL
jgi:ribosomal protein S18 acetylase RimI-like enzyme